ISLAIILKIEPFLPVLKVLTKKSFGVELGMLFHLVFGAVLLFGGLYFGSSVWSSSLSVTELKIGLVVFGIVKLFLELADKMASNPIVDNLNECRQQLIFGSISEVDAERIVRIYLGSAKLADYLRDEISSILNRQENIVSSIKGISDELARHTSISEVDFEKEAKIRADDYIKELQSRVARLGTLINADSIDVNKLTNKLDFYSKFNPDLQSEVMQTLDPLNQMRGQLLREQIRFNVLINDFKKNKASPSMKPMTTFNTSREIPATPEQVFTAFQHEKHL